MLSDRENNRLAELELYLRVSEPRFVARMNRLARRDTTIWYRLRRKLFRRW